MTTMKKKTFDLILQIIPVMIGVYLGFVISNWGEDRKKEKQSEVFIKNIRSEMSLNKEKLLSVIDYHKILRDSSRFYLINQATYNLNKPPDFFEGIRTEALLESAYSTGIQTGIISELDLNRIQKLNQLYAYQKEYNEYIKITLEGLISMDFDNNEKSIKKILQFISISMADIVVKESQLIKSYDNILKIDIK
jgi:hypothetical protein